jgi:hypothetical protein
MNISENPASVVTLRNCLPISVQFGVCRTPVSAESTALSPVGHVTVLSGKELTSIGR